MSTILSRWSAKLGLGRPVLDAQTINKSTVTNLSVGYEVEANDALTDYLQHANNADKYEGWKNDYLQSFINE